MAHACMQLSGIVQTGVASDMLLETLEGSDGLVGQGNAHMHV